jgi:hypothetical protein
MRCNKNEFKTLINASGTIIEQKRLVGDFTALCSNAIVRCHRGTILSGGTS